MEESDGSVAGISLATVIHVPAWMRVTTTQHLKICSGWAIFCLIDPSKFRQYVLRKRDRLSYNDALPPLHDALPIDLRILTQPQALTQFSSLQTRKLFLGGHLCNFIARFADN